MNIIYSNLFCAPKFNCALCLRFNMIAENSVDGQTLRIMTAKDMRDIFPTLLKRKKLRDWVTSLVCMKTVLETKADLHFQI